MKLTTVARVGDIEENGAIMVEIEGREIGVFHAEGAYYAMNDTCPHREAYLHEGHIEGATVTCPWHFAVIDLKTGHPQSGPVDCPLKTYEVTVEGQEIKILFENNDPD